jgi:hypothetical protein
MVQRLDWPLWPKGLGFYFMLKVHFFLWTNEKDDVIFKQILFGEGDLIKCPQLPRGKRDL